MSNKLDSFDFFVIGEEHYQKSNRIWQLEIFKYLHEKEGVNHFLIEYGESRGIIINQYLNTGDNKLLQRLAAVKDDYLFYFKLKEYYDKQDSNNKFLVHGIDYEKESIENVGFAIKLLLEEKKQILSEPSIEFLKNYSESSGQEELLKSIFLFFSKISKDSTKYYNELEESYSSIIMMYNSIKANIKGVKYKKNKPDYLHDKRELLIYNQIRTLHATYIEDKFFCVFGTAHLALNYHEDWALFNFKTFITLLNTEHDSPFKGRVFSIIPLYKSNIPRWKKNYPKKKIGLSENNIEELDTKCKENVFTLFECPRRTNEGKNLRSEYYQMILVINW